MHSSQNRTCEDLRRQLDESRQQAASLEQQLRLSMQIQERSKAELKVAEREMVRFICVISS